MIYTQSGAEALAKREVVNSPGTGIPHWGTVFFGTRTSTSAAPGPQATMSELNPSEALVPHFHGVTMFQLFIAGSGTLGKNAQPLQPITVQFKDHHTAYGPVVAGPQGLSFVALRMRTGDSAPVYLDRPGYREKLKPSKRRHLTSAPVGLSIEPVLRFRKEPVWEPLLEQGDDGFAAHVVRLGANMSADGPDPRKAGGYYVFVANGSLMQQDKELALWSMAVVEPNENGFELRAGDRGLEALVLQYPKEDQ
jgi:hypothetical protein